MGYYNRGDYQTGGYGYGRGDPGFLSSLWKGIKKVAPAVLGFAVGGPAGAAIGAGLGGGRTPPIMAPMAPQIPASQRFRDLATRVRLPCEVRDRWESRVQMPAHALSVITWIRRPARGGFAIGG